MKIENLEAYCLDVAQRAKAASTELASVTGKQKNDWLNLSAQALRDRMDEVLAANDQDIANAPGFGLTPAEIDRLKLNPQILKQQFEQPQLLKLGFQLKLKQPQRLGSDPQIKDRAK